MTRNDNHDPSTFAKMAWRDQVELAQDKQWLASLLLHYGERLFQRFASFYDYLCSLPRRTRLKLQRKAALSVASAALMLALSGAPLPAHAASITVVNGEVVISNNSQCSLREAIINANNGVQTHTDCESGSVGADTINLPTGGTFTITDAFDVGDKQGLPVVSTEIIIEGNGATIQVSGVEARILSTSTTGNLTLNNLTIKDGYLFGAGGYGYTDHGGGLYNNGVTIANNTTFTNNGGPNVFGGAIYNDRTGGSPSRGHLTLNNSTISGSTAAHGAGIFNEGVITLNDSTLTGNSATSQGGGVRTRVESPVSAYFNRSIISGNSAPTAAEIIVDSGSSAVAANYNVFGDSSKTNASAFSSFTPSGSDVTATSDGTDSTAIGSILNTSLADNGGPTNTHALVSGSPAVDTIPTSDGNCNPGTSLDQRGAARGNGSNQGGSACDSGAFEYASSQTPTAIVIEGFTAHGENGAGAAAVGVTGLLALLTGGWLVRGRKRKV